MSHQPENPYQFKPHDIAYSIILAQMELRSATSSMLGVLFWEIGTLLNNHPETNYLTGDSLSQNKPGALFGAEQLKGMQQVAKRIGSEAEIYRLCSITDWEHLVVLATIEKEETFYALLNTSITCNWDTEQLYQAVVSYSDEIKPLKINSGNALDQIIKETYKRKIADLQNQAIPDTNNKVLKNMVSDAYLPFFCELFEIRQTTSTEQVPEPYASIDKKIQQFNHEYYVWLSRHLSAFAWQTGQVLNNWMLGPEENPVPQPHLFEELTTILKETHKIHLTSTILATFASIQKQISSLDIALYIGQHVNWEQLLELLNITDDLEKIYYVSILSQQSAENTSLKDIIQSHNYALLSDTEKEEIESTLNFLKKSGSASNSYTQHVLEDKGSYETKRFNQLSSSPIFDLLRQV